MHKGIRRAIGLYELLTGGYGCLWLIDGILLARGGSLSTLLFVTLCALNAVAGSWLWNGQAGGVRLSILTQLLQSVQIAAGSLRYLFTAGLALRVNVGQGSHFTHAFGIQFEWSWSSGALPFQLGVNLVALAMLTYLIYASRTDRKSA